MRRREFLRDAALAGTAGALGLRPRVASAEPPPETMRLRIPLIPSICVAPVYVAEDLLRGEGFSDIQWVSGGPTGLANFGVPGAKRMGAGEIDVGMNFAAPLVVALDAGTPIVVLAGVHVGCFELIATERVRTISDLKGKSVAVLALGSAQHIFLSSMATQVGLDPRRDITWVTSPANEAKQLLAEGKIDGFLGFPPDPQELRAKKVGHVVVNSATDRPWSQYFCCMAVANREFATKYPVATKRALRAILKASQICALEPERAARAYLGRGFQTREDFAVQAVKEIPYGRWREYKPEETIRFYALRLHEAGMVKSSPQKLIAQGTDWRFLNELKKELKG
jgi:NitT/TauT family transport system substrate-binding protein